MLLTYTCNEGNVCILRRRSQREVGNNVEAKESIESRHNCSLLFALVGKVLATSYKHNANKPCTLTTSKLFHCTQLVFSCTLCLVGLVPTTKRRSRSAYVAPELLRGFWCPSWPLPRTATHARFSFGRIVCGQTNKDAVMSNHEGEKIYTLNQQTRKGTIDDVYRLTESDQWLVSRMRRSLPGCRQAADAQKWHGSSSSSKKSMTVTVVRRAD